MKIAVIVSDATGLVNAGLDVERSVRMFDAPPELAWYVTQSRGNHITVTLAIEDQEAS